MLVDSHCHLDMLDLSADRGGLEAFLEAARGNGVAHMLCVSVNLEDYPAMCALTAGHRNVSVSVGVHPNEREGKDPDTEELLALARDPRVVAIGETGLDYFRSEGDLEWQRDRLRRHIAAARGCGKPLIIHSRQAREDTLAVLAEERAGEAGGVMHCFAEDWDMARRAMDLGFYISFSGIVTFKSARELQDVAQRVPLDRMLVETDSPYLAPVPHRGRPNQPAYVRHVAEFIAELRGEPLERIAEATTANFTSLFGVSVTPF
ncbi:MAG: TatD family hydrolase [Gammaproteobacteria bacterium]